MEANKYAWRMTAHKCDAASNKHYWNCDKGGCGTDMWRSNPNSYGPGSQYTINTERQFTAEIHFNETNSELSSIEVHYY